jgi:serine/threonine-protein kinase
VALADRLADAASAELGAFYGRCAHLPHHDLGGWFRGADAAAAAAALVYGVGFFTEQPAVSRRAMEGLGPSPLDGLRAAAAKLDAAELGRLIGAEGGSITAGEGKAITMTFPVGGPTRATRASRIVAEKIGLSADGG